MLLLVLHIKEPEQVLKKVISDDKYNKILFLLDVELDVELDD
jgi:hypothetical protein